jgi:hypothetical protein
MEARLVINAATSLKLPKNITLQDLGGDEGGVLLNMDSGEMYTINETTLAFLQELDGKRTVSQAAERLLAEYEVDEATLVADLLQVAEDLHAESLVEIAGK